MFGSSDKRNLDDVYDKLEAINSKLGELTNIQETIETNHKETVSALGNIESAIKNTETFFKDTNSKLGELTNIQETIETNHKETVSALGNIESAIKNTETFFKDTNSKLGELIKVASDQSI